ncbi:hypothetical protein [Polyangium aurulentum]|uniref:hypothetical protein n=1 Tax=Polyangium aurulentum TaxID=2567896 RepID=UPI0010AE0945|nr:hypothetical protein [Polyangium aurulentum]UQA56373.1 hypothetical protein E8A73_034405 [Polyangium aurulentum]
MFARRGLSVLSSLPALAALLVATAGRAEESAKPFGERGQVAFDDIVALTAGGSRFGYPLTLPGSAGSSSFSIGYSGMLGYEHDTTSYSPGQPGGSASVTDTMFLAPSLDVFVGGGFSVGATIAASYAFGKLSQTSFDGETRIMEGSGYGFAIAPRVGYVIPIGPSFALWPRITIGYSGGYTAYDSDTPGAAFTSANGSVRGIAELGLVARVHRMVYLRAAPELVIGVSDASRTGSGTLQTNESHDFAVRLGARAGLGILLGG